MNGESYEIEIKSLLGSRENAEKLKERMRTHDPNLRELGRHRQLNHYFVGGNLASLHVAVAGHISTQGAGNFLSVIPRAKDFSLRTRDADGKIILVLKIAVDDTTSANGTGRLEFETPLPGFTLDQLDQLILSCGFSYQAKWSREREEYECDSAHVTIDRNAGYGYLAEFEIVASDANEIEGTKARLRDLMRAVGAEELDAARLERMFAFYNTHWAEYYGTEKVFTIA